MRPLLELAAAHAPTLPTQQRADLYEGIAIATRALDKKLSEQASAACEALRDAEAHQLTFAALLRPATPQA